MVRLRNGLSVLAAFGLVVAAPVSAATRAAQSLPAVSAQIDRVSTVRGSQPAVQASALANEDDDDSPTGLILGGLALLAAILLAMSAGGTSSGGVPDSPG